MDRLQLHQKLIEVLGSRNVYFQAPTKMNYPCIKYELAKKDSKFANGKRYINKKIYTITIIDADPCSSIPDRLEELPYVKFERTPYVSDGLHHFVYSITI